MMPKPYLVLLTEKNPSLLHYIAHVLALLFFFPEIYWKGSFILHLQVCKFNMMHVLEVIYFT